MAQRRKTPVRRRIAQGGARAKQAATRARDRAINAAQNRYAARTLPPHLSLLRTPALPMSNEAMGRKIRVATYNVHRWTGLNGRSKPDPARAAFVISELDADVFSKLTRLLFNAGRQTRNASGKIT